MADRPYLIGMAGGSGSGKTSLIRALRSRWTEGHVSVVSQDDYYHPRERQARDENGRINYDLPSAVDLDALAADLFLIRNGGTIRRKEYTFNQEGRDPAWVEVPPAPVVLVEGLFVLHHEEVRNQFDLRVFVDASEHTQLARRLQRDAMERGYGAEEVMYQWSQHVLPAYRTWLMPYRELCEVHVLNEASMDDAIMHLERHLGHLAGSARDPLAADPAAPSHKVVQSA